MHCQTQMLTATETDLQAATHPRAVQGGDLRKALRGEKGQRLDWWNGGKQVAIDSARGLAFLHANNVIHRDMKSMNILLAKVRAPNFLSSSCLDSCC